MRHEAHIGLVYAHAEGDGRHNDDAFLSQETSLMRGSQLGREARVIGQGIKPLQGEPASYFLGLLARQTVDNAGVPRVLVFQKL